MNIGIPNQATRTRDLKKHFGITSSRIEVMIETAVKQEFISGPNLSHTGAKGRPWHFMFYCKDEKGRWMRAGAGFHDNPRELVECYLLRAKHLPRYDEDHLPDFGISFNESPNSKIVRAQMHAVKETKQGTAATPPKFKRLKL